MAWERVSLTMLTCVVLSPQLGLSQHPAFGSGEPDHEIEWLREGDAVCLCVTLSVDGRDRQTDVCTDI